MPSVSNGLYFLTLPLVSVMRVIYRKIRHARYLYIKRNVEKVWGPRYTLGVRYLSKNTVNGIQTPKAGKTFYIRTSCEGKSKITLMGDLVKLISYKVKLRISELLTRETMYSVFF